MEAYEYIKPKNLNDAIRALNQYKNPFMLAGGTDLLVNIKHNDLHADCIIDIKDIPKMDSFGYGDGWRFGALTTIRDIETSEQIREKTPFLAETARALGSIQIRNRATLGGNLCNASPCSNFGTMFLAMDAVLKIVSKDGERMIALKDFFVGPNRTVLKKGDMLAEIIVPTDHDGAEGIFLKHCAGRSNDLGLVAIAIVLNREPGSDVCKKISIAMGAVAPTPMRAKQAEAMLVGRQMTSDLIAEVAQKASDESVPISDFRASAEYRRELVRNMVAKGIRSLVAAS